jgi:tripartite-type tricarboxylate transporter receptor subunit TctC
MTAGMRSPQRAVAIAAVVSGAGMMAIACVLNAQPFPSKTGRLVVPFPPGGSNDVVARALSTPLGKALGQSVVIENRPGANTVIGTEAVARAPADGHTVLSERSSLLKEVPTMMEAGQPDFDMSGAMGAFAPAATPKAALERLNSELTRAVQLPDVKEGMLRDGFVVAPIGLAEYEAFMRAKVQQIQKIARAANIKLD